MNEAEYLDDVDTSETSVSEDSTESDIEAVTEISDNGSYNPVPVSEVTDVSETSAFTSVSDYDHMLVVENNTHGILLMTSGIFFLLIIALIAKLFGGYLSM